MLKLEEIIEKIDSLFKNVDSVIYIRIDKSYVYTSSISINLSKDDNNYHKLWGDKFIDFKKIKTYVIEKAKSYIDKNSMIGVYDIVKTECNKLIQLFIININNITDINFKQIRGSWMNCCTGYLMDRQSREYGFSFSSELCDKIINELINNKNILPDDLLLKLTLNGII